MENTTQFNPHEANHPDFSVTTAAFAFSHINDNYAFLQTLQETINIFCMVISSIVFVLGVFGNGLVIFITGFRMKKTVSTVLFLNLAIADFIFLFFLPLQIAPLAPGFHWQFGEAMFTFNYTMTVVNLCASIYFLMVISADRCISVLFPVWSRNHRNPHRASFVAFGVWILALVLSAPEIHITKSLYTAVNCNSNCNHDMERTKVNLRAMFISRFIFAFAIPFLVIIVCYGAIFLRLRRDRLAWSSKPFKVITAVIVAFFVCWFPFHVFSFLLIPAFNDPLLLQAVIIGFPLVSSLTLINSCLNPILYVCMGHDFKEKLKHSIFSVFENTFAEEKSQSTKQTIAKSSVELDSQII